MRLFGIGIIALLFAAGGIAIAEEPAPAQRQEPQFSPLNVLEEPPTGIFRIGRGRCADGTVGIRLENHGEERTHYIYYGERSSNAPAQVLFYEVWIRPGGADTVCLDAAFVRNSGRRTFTFWIAAFEEEGTNIIARGVVRLIR